MDEQQLRTDAQAILQRLGPLTAADLSRRLVEAGHPVAEDAQYVRDLLLSDAHFAWDRDGQPTREPGTFAAYPLTDGRLVDLDHLLDGLVVTHRIGDEERRAGEVEPEPDLMVAHILAPDGSHIPLAGGGTLTFTDTGAFAGPAGWLPDDPVLVLTLRDGLVEVAGADDVPGPDQTTADRLAAAYEVIVDRGPFREVPELLVEARARYPKLLAEPQAPLSELLEPAGLRQHGARLHRADEPPPATTGLTDELTDHLRDDHGFDDREVADLLQVTNGALASVNAVLRRTSDLVDETTDPEELQRALDEVEGALDDVLDPEVASALARLLERTPTTTAVLHDVVGTEGMLAAAVFGMLEAVDDDLRDRHTRANAHWLRARLLEFLADDHADAERELRQALNADRDHGEATFDLARYRADRGEAGAALGLLRQLEGGGDPAWVELLEDYAEPGPTAAGRNDPCPCGSGRKHKVCCGPRNGWPLDHRWPWIWDKVWRNGLMAHSFEIIEEVAHTVGRGDEPLSDPVVSNLATFEAGLIERFVDTRGSLLPADELDLLRDLAEVRARACEVVAVERGNGLEVLDLLEGERLRLVDVTMSRNAEVGDVFLLWVVPMPDGLGPWEGGIKVPPGAVDSLLEILDEDPDDPYALADWYGWVLAPPGLRNTEGEPLVLTTLRIGVPDGAAARGALAERLEDEGDHLTEYAEDEDGQRWVRGTVEVEGDTLVVQANSAARARRLHDLVTELAPEAELLDAERIPADELTGRDLDDEDGPSGAIDLDALDEEDRAALEEQLDRFMAEQEDRWLDSPIPALDGATPREAAEDPTRRGDLDRLLRDFAARAAEWEGPGRAMDAARLRRELGLD